MLSRISSSLIRGCAGGGSGRIIECGELIGAEPLLFGGCGGVVAVDVDDHRPASW